MEECYGKERPQNKYGKDKDHGLWCKSSAKQTSAGGLDDRVECATELGPTLHVYTEIRAKSGSIDHEVE